MATLRTYVDGGFYLLRVYPVRSNTNEGKSFFTTIQIHPRGQRLFELLRLRDGTKISKPVFYALLVDGDLESPSIRQHPPTVRSIPDEVVYIAEGIAQSDAGLRILRNPHFANSRYLIDFYLAYTKLERTSDAVDFSAQLCIARHLRQAAYENQIHS